MENQPPLSDTNDFHIQPAEAIEIDAVCSLYDSVGWSIYTKDPNQLMKAITGSDFLVTALEGGQLIGLARALSDDSTIAYVQDILVRPTHQGRGVGRGLLKAILDRYRHVRQKVLLTDDRPEQLRFYDSMGFQNTRELSQTPLNAFVLYEGVRLS